MDVEKKDENMTQFLLPSKKIRKEKTVSQGLKISNIHFFFYLMVFLMFHDYFFFK